MNIAVIIPAFRPEPALFELVRDIAESQFTAIFIIDDGSGPEFQGIFEECRRLPRTTVLQHATNFGKGAALKTGMHAAISAHPDIIGVVTADADGQHDPADIRCIAVELVNHPDRLVLGVRTFSGAVPLRSRAGNLITRAVMRLLLGQRLTDTQTGLRGIPRTLIPCLLRIGSSGYEFELDVLIAVKHHGCAVWETAIRTIYREGNRCSHFNPLVDSMKIYFVLLRFCMLSLVTAGIDNLIFVLCFYRLGSILPSQIAGRVVAVAFNYSAARSAVFFSRERHRATLPKYLFLVLASGTCSYVLIRILHAKFDVPVIWAKLIAESSLFIVNFVVQRDFVFTRRSKRTMQGAQTPSRIPQTEEYACDSKLPTTQNGDR
ncbi:MAG: bifunctional glycosyltransferase family 2/GtrA family protein [Bryobacteraceae bacterium]